MTTRERETRHHRTQNGTRRHANMRRFLSERTRKSKQRAAQLWEEETTRTAVSTAAAIFTLILWNLAALKFFEVL